VDPDNARLGGLVKPIRALGSPHFAICQFAFLAKGTELWLLGNLLLHSLEDVSPLVPACFGAPRRFVPFIQNRTLRLPVEVRLLLVCQLPLLARRPVPIVQLSQLWSLPLLAQYLCVRVVNSA
jgi:hypothetical protein